MRKRRNTSFENQSQIGNPVLKRQPFLLFASSLTHSCDMSVNDRYHTRAQARQSHSPNEDVACKIHLRGWPCERDFIRTLASLLSLLFSPKADTWRP